MLHISGRRRWSHLRRWSHFTRIVKYGKIRCFWGKKTLRNGSRFAKISIKLSNQPFFEGENPYNIIQVPPPPKAWACMSTFNITITLRLHYTWHKFLCCSLSRFIQHIFGDKLIVGVKLMKSSIQCWLLLLFNLEVLDLHGMLKYWIACNMFISNDFYAS